MASPESMKKEELVAQVRKLTQELKRLLFENETLRAAKDGDLTFDSSAISLVARPLAKVVPGETGQFEVHIINYDSNTGRGVIKEKLLFDKRHMAEFDANKLFHMKILKGEL